MRTVDAEKKKVDAETRKKTAPFPDIIVDIKGDIILCIACKGSNLTRQDDGNNVEGHPSEDKRREECPSTVMANVYVCNDCGAVWWQ